MNGSGTGKEEFPLVDLSGGCGHEHHLNSAASRLPRSPGVNGPCGGGNSWRHLAAIPATHRLSRQAGIASPAGRLRLACRSVEERLQCASSWPIPERAQSTVVRIVGILAAADPLHLGEEARFRALEDRTERLRTL